MPETRPCALPDCDKPKHQGWKYCGSHYMKWYRHGDPYYVAPKRYGPDLTGRRVGSLVILGRVDGSARWQAQCDCGNITVLLTGDINRGTTKTCAVPGRHVRKEIVTYAGAHNRVEATYGRAKTHQCVDCGGAAYEWSYDHADPNELEETLFYGAKPVTVTYSLSPEHYLPRCRPCHWQFDTANARRRRWFDALVKYEADIT